MDFCKVGLKNGIVKEDDITASSSWGGRYLPRYGRLDRVGTPSTNGGWLASTRTGWIYD